MGSNVSCLKVCRRCAGSGEALDAEVIADFEGDVSAIVVNGLSAIRDDIDFVTVNTSASLPESYESSEARRFH